MITRTIRTKLFAQSCSIKEGKMTKFAYFYKTLIAKYWKHVNNGQEF